ncbi:MAG TPA: flagellar protein FlaG [Stenomitos sp.]
MRIEGAIAISGMVTQQSNQVDAQNQRSQAQIASIPADAQEAARRGADAKPVGDQLLEQAVGQVEQLVNTFNEGITFKVHKETKATIISVVNRDNGEVIRQIPSEKFLDMIAMFQKQLSGLLVDTNG